MDKLPPELLLKIAGYCDFADVCAISKLNRQWNELIESNWNSLKKQQVNRIMFHQNEDNMEVQCDIRLKDDREKTLQLKMFLNEPGSVNAAEALEDCWTILRDDWNYLRWTEVRPMDAETFLEDLFTPIFRRSTIDQLYLDFLNSSTLRMIISLLERFGPTVHRLTLSVGSIISLSENSAISNSISSSRIQELADSARIIELSKPDRLEIYIDDRFAKEDICEHFLKRIANLYIPRVIMSSTGHYFGGRHRNRSFLYGPLPKCRVLKCKGQPYWGIPALPVSDIVDLVEEWSNNERDIDRYELRSFPGEMWVVAGQIAEELQKRNLPVRFEVVHENEEFLIKKIATRGDSQDELRLTCRIDGEHRVSGNLEIYERLDRVIIQTKQSNNA